MAFEGEYFYFKMFPLRFDDDHLQLKNIAQFPMVAQTTSNIKQSHASSSSLNLKIGFITAYQLCVYFFHYLFIVILISYFSGFFIDFDSVNENASQ